MPIFDFLCNECGHTFDMLIKNDEKEKVQCPQCQSKDVKQQLSTFYTGDKMTAKTYGPTCENCSAKG